VTLLFDQVNPDHFLCRMDGRVKVISSLLLLIMILSYQGLVLPLVVCASGLALCLSIGISPKRLLLRFSEPLFIVFVIVLLKAFFSGNTAVASFSVRGFHITIHSDSLLDGVRIGCRILGAVTAVAVLGFVTPFGQFMGALSWLRVPRGFVEVSLFAYRYIFMLFDDAMVIYNAQKNRLGYSTIKRGLSSFGILTGSLVLKAFENSQSTAVAMAQRGYEGNIPGLEQLPLRASDVVFPALFLFIMGVLWKI
jgi:cobalt/nickel transport system permease protein